MKYLILLSLCLLTTACNDDFLERYPLDEVSPQNFSEVRKRNGDLH